MRTFAGSFKSSNTGLNEPIINFRDTNPARALFKYSQFNVIDNRKGGILRKVGLSSIEAKPFYLARKPMIGIGWQQGAAEVENETTIHGRYLAI